MLNFIQVGRNNLFEILREIKEYFKEITHLTKITWTEDGLRLIETKYTKPNGDVQLNYKTVVYQKVLNTPLIAKKG